MEYVICHMYMISNRLYIAINICLFIAYNGSKDRTIPVSAIVNHYGLKKRSLELVLQKLSASNILVSTRGSGGGYYVSNLATITLKDIATCINQGLFPPEEKAFSEFRPVVSKHLKLAHIALQQQLEEVTLAMLCHDAERLGIPLLDANILDFTI